MNDINLVSITPAPSRSRQGQKPRILLLKPPYFTPWTPPLGIAILKSFMEQRGYSVTCFDFNTDPELWGMHHKYFSIIQRLEDVSINDGYSKLWWILNAHLLAYANGADASAIAKVLSIVIPLYGIRHDDELIEALIPVVDRYFKRLGQVADQQLKLAEYGVVGTSTYTTSLASSLFLLKRIKERNPGVTTVMGGGIFADDLALGSDNLDTLVAECSYIDHVVLGEGEMLFLKLLEGELAHKRVITISDLKGTTLDMKDVPTPDFSDLELENYYHLSIEGARSCPFQCSFCSETIQWGDYRKKPVDQFADQVLELANRFKMKEFFMGDSLMNPYINPFSLELIERKANVLYDGYLRADKPVTNRKFVKMWADSGLFRVRLGIESAAANVLNTMDKMTTPKVISDVLKTLASAGIRTTTYWIVGFPGESEADFKGTCDFIREHYRYIYELEAHPYYYYPYGQVGSRLYQCSSLYPEEVTQYTKFKVWEIDDANPPRDVRYERLRKLAKMCADLGLINIYTMTERYQAEDRWHRLHPLAIDVYQSGRVDRKRSTLSDVSVEAPREVSTFAPASVSSVICYEATISKQLNEETLGAALVELINYNEILQLSLRDGKYVVDSNTGALDPNELFSVFQLEATDHLSRAKTRAHVVAELAKEMEPTSGNSMRAALIKDDETGVELLLVVHRGVADAKSVTLLFEDLFRIYEQLSNKREISLRPVTKTSISALMNLPELPVAVFEPVTAKTTMIEIDERIMPRLLARTIDDYGIDPSDVLVHAVTRIISQLKRKGSVGLDLRIDSRVLDEQFEHTPGPLTRTCSLNGVATVPGQSRSALLETHQIIADALSGIASLTKTEPRILLNFEFWSEKPWLGQDQWQPKGFVSNGGPLAASYLLEITPVEAGRGLHVYVKYHESAAAIAQALVDELVPEIDAIVKTCESFAEAKEYWRQEFSTVVPRSTFFIDSDAQLARLTRSSFNCALDRLALKELAAQCSVDLTTVILAVYSVVLSRMDGNEDLALVASPGEVDGFVPLRINLPWTVGFKEYAQQLQQKLGVAYHHGAEVFDILSDLAKGPTFDAAYVFRDESETDKHANGKITGAFPESISDGLKLSLEVTMDWKGMSWRFNHDQSCLKPDAIERLSSSFSSILSRVAKDVYMPLSDAVLDTDEKLLLESSFTIEEFESTFSF